MKKKTILKLDGRFLRLARDTVKSEEFSEMKRIRLHKNTTLYRHSLKVAYLCYRRLVRRGADDALRETVRGALLHDFYLYDKHKDGERHRLHWLRHPSLALVNAENKYPDLSNTERDAIARHMFPITLLPPRTRAGRLVCFYDKIAAIGDRFEKNRNNIS